MCQRTKRIDQKFISFRNLYDSEYQIYKLVMASKEMQEFWYVSFLIGNSFLETTSQKVNIQGSSVIRRGQKRELWTMTFLSYLSLQLLIYKTGNRMYWVPLFPNHTLALRIIIPFLFHPCWLYRTVSRSSMNHCIGVIVWQHDNLQLCPWVCPDRSA